MLHNTELKIFCVKHLKSQISKRQNKLTTPFTSESRQNKLCFMLIDYYGMVYNSRKVLSVSNGKAFRGASNVYTAVNGIKM